LLCNGSFAFCSIPSLTLVGRLPDDADTGADTDDQHRIMRRKTQPAMVMTMKKTTSLNISVAESEARLDASACHPLVGGEARTTLMARWLILAIYFRN